MRAPVMAFSSGYGHNNNIWNAIIKNMNIMMLGDVHNSVQF